MPDNEAQGNTQRDVLRNLIKLLREITGKEGIVLSEHTTVQPSDKSNSAPVVNFVLKTLNLTSEDIIYQSIVAQYPLTNPFIEAGSNIQIKPSDYDSTPTFADSTSVVFKQDHVQVAQTLSEGDYKHKSNEQILPIDSGEARIRILLIVYEIVNYLKDLEKKDPTIGNYTSGLLDSIADILVNFVYEQLEAQRMKESHKIVSDIATTNYLGEIVPYIAVTKHQIDASDSDITITFCRVNQLLHLSDQDSFDFDSALKTLFTTTKNDELKVVFDDLAQRIPEERLEVLAIEFAVDTNDHLNNTWGESFCLNIQTLTKQWLFRSITREKASVAEDGSIKQPKASVSSAYSNGANLKSIFFLLGLLGYVTPQQGLKAYE